MAINFGADPLGSTPPTGYLQESSLEETQEQATIRDSDGRIVVAIAKPRSIVTTNLTTKGEVSLMNVPMGDFSGNTITASKVSETNDDFAVSTVTYTLYK
jgi:hypothetical protein